MFYPLELKNHGRINIKVEVEKGEKKDDVSVMLVDIRVFNEDKDNKMDKNLWQKWVDFEHKYAPVKLFTIKNLSKTLDAGKRALKSFLGIGKKQKPPKWFHGLDVAKPGNNANILHTVDDQEIMETEGKYVVKLINDNKSKIEGTIMIEFPGEIFDVERDLWEKIEHKTDLYIKDISVGRGNRIVITLGSSGGFIPNALWSQKGEKAVILRVTVGEKVIETKLQDFDPKRQIKYGQTIYTIPDIEITEETPVTVFIDATNQVAERTKANNKKTETLSPKEQSSPRQN